MPSLRDIRRRIRSVTSTARITKAMEMVAAARMRRTQQRVLAGRPYAETIGAVLRDLAASSGFANGESSHPLLERRPVKRVGLVLFTSDRGLAGGLNANMTREASKMFIESSVPISVVAVGRKGRDFMVRLSRPDRELRAEFTGLGDSPSLLDIAPIARQVMDDYLDGYVDAVFVGYNRFVNTLVQRPVIEQVLPIAIPEGDSRPVDFIFEPNADDVLRQLAPRYVEMQIFHAMTEAIASEFSARMVAMRNATQSANDVITDLTLTANKLRQEAITSELLDLVGGVAALNG